MTHEKDQPSSLAKWVLLAQSGDKSAFESLVEETQRKLYRFCVALSSDRGHADDLFQETYIRAFTKIKNLRDPGQFEGWLFKIAKNVYLDQKRYEKSATQGKESIKIHTPVESTAEPANAISVRRALSQFKPKDQYLLSLIDLAEFTYAEAAEIFGESEAALKSRVFRLRKAFVKILSEG